MMSPGPASVGSRLASDSLNSDMCSNFGFVFFFPLDPFFLGDLEGLETGVVIELP